MKIKKTTLVLIIIINIFFVLGCSSKEQTAAKAFQVDDRIAALGTPQYTKVSATGFEILPFPGLTYNGIRDGKQAFYAANKDYTFAIYTDQGITDSGKSFEDAMQEYKTLYNAYNPKCAEISTEGWLTKARAFSCRYYIDSIDADYKSTVFYRDGAYFETIVGVWGTQLREYEYIFDAFDAQAVKWN